MIHDQRDSILVHVGRTLGPHCPNEIEPCVQLFAELPRTRVVGAPELADKAKFAEKRNPFSTPSREAPIGEPCEQVEGRRAARECLRRLQIGWDWVAGDLSARELVTEARSYSGIRPAATSARVPRIPDPGLGMKLNRT